MAVPKVDEHGRPWLSLFGTFKFIRLAEHRLVDSYNKQAAATPGEQLRRLVGIRPLAVEYIYEANDGSMISFVDMDNCDHDTIRELGSSLDSGSYKAAEAASHVLAALRGKAGGHD